MNTHKLHPRYAAERLKEALSDTPAVLIHGPRQAGKTTLARVVGEPMGFSYFSFDNPALAGAAAIDPIGFVDDLPERTILDEVQRVPEIFPALKIAIDRRRTPGRFLLTGSANVMFVPKLAESLAGRLLETFVFQELRRQASWYRNDVDFFHFRDRDNFEVDIVLERRSSELAGIEVKAAATVTAADFRGLRKLRDAAKDRFVAGVVLYDGETSVGFGDRLHAVPIRLLWDLQSS